MAVPVVGSGGGKTSEIIFALVTTVAGHDGKRVERVGREVATAC